MDWFSLCLNTAVITTQGILQMGFICRLTGRASCARYYIGYLLVLAAIEVASGFLGFSGVAAIGLQMLSLYGINRLMLKNNRPVSWIAAVLAVYITQLCFGMANSVEAVLFSPAVRGWPLYAALLLVVLVEFAACAGCYRLVLGLLSLKEAGELPYMGLLLLPGLFLVWAELYILHTAYSSLPAAFSWAEAGKHLVLLCLQALGLGALFCTLYAWRGICEGYRVKAELSCLAQAVGAQKTYIAEAQQRYGRTRAFRHDIRNHLSVLSGLLHAGKTEEARQYLKKMEAVSAALSVACLTGNVVVDVLLSEKLRIAQDKGIHTECSLRLPSAGQVDDFDWCVLLANALDNAVAGCEEASGSKAVSGCEAASGSKALADGSAASSGEPYIRIEGRCQGAFYFLALANSCAENLREPPAEGTGLAGIRAVATKYGGAVKTAADGGEFRLEVLLILSQQPSRIS